MIVLFTDEFVSAEISQDDKHGSGFLQSKAFSVKKPFIFSFSK